MVRKALVLAFGLALAAMASVAPAVPITDLFCRVSTSGCVSAPQCAGEVAYQTQCGTRANGTPRFCVPDGRGCCGCGV